MKIDIITIFPSMFDAVLNESIVKRAQDKGIVVIQMHDLRDYSSGKHKKVDDRPFGGGPGMVISPVPVFKAVEAIDKTHHTRIIFMTPDGEKYNQSIAKDLSEKDHLIFLCGHYEGIDERIRQELVTDEISIGDYILTCGELPVMVCVDSVIRLLPGVLGCEDSNKCESFENNLLEYPHYTRPENFRGMKVPEVLISGNHKKIEQWRYEQALKKTKKRRPDLLKK